MNKTQDPNNTQIMFGLRNEENITKEFITKQFINNLKLEICQKVKPSKSILEALKHSNTINQAYKKSIEQLNARTQALFVENQKLKERIVQLEYNIKEKDNITNSLIYSASLKRSESQRAEQLKNHENIQAANDSLIQVQILKDKIRHLEEYKVLKQARFTQIIQREAQYVGEINLIKYKNETLESTIKTLEASLQNLKVKNEALAFEQKMTRKKSEASQRFKSYINQQDSFKSDESIQEMKEIQHLIIPKQNNNSLLVSCTKAMDIEQSYNLQANENKNSQKVSLNQIDIMLGQEVLNFKTNSLINDSEKESPENLNSSIIVININPS